ncbi:hypothetical protein HD806DRAFT_515568 [Xylariaceae sp. AK1471]|nr:hypothetical protein HD806DRAFT_515568 [Xylariaceae sp. AK1471]
MAVSTMNRSDQTQTQYHARELRTMPAHIRGWECDHWKRFPWLASCAFIVVLVLFAAMAVVLHTSDNQEVSSWPSSQRSVPVSVILAILVNVANICLAIALSQGYTVSWWREALKGAELSRLQFDLSVQHGFAALLQSSRSFSRFLLAALVALIVSIANGPILQRASTTGLLTLGPTNTTVAIFIAPEPLPANFSAWSGSGFAPSLLTPVFGNVSKAYASNEDIMLPYAGCDGNSSCRVTMAGPGLDAVCNDSSVSYDYRHLSAAIPEKNNITAFNITLEFGIEDLTIAGYSMVNFTVLFKPDPACIGNFVRRSCSMRLATVEYPIIISNGTAVLQPWQPSRNETIQLINFSNTISDGHTIITPELWTGVNAYNGKGLQSMLGGIFSVSRSLYESSANLRLPAKEGLVVTVTGLAATNYLTSDISTYGDCTMTWEDPTTDIVNTARELMFRSVIANSLANSSYSTPQELSATSTRVITAYRTRFEYLGIAIGLMLLEGAVILFLLWGWRDLGRDMSLDAFEIGNALGAPLLREASSNATVEDILEASGRKRIRYGEIIRSETRLETRPDAPLSFPEASNGVDNSIGQHTTAHYDVIRPDQQGWETNEKDLFRVEMPSEIGALILGFSEAANVRSVTPGQLYH